ncbi:hypothetical protein D3C81_1809950 [compost metagenome]
MLAGVSGIRARIRTGEADIAINRIFLPPRAQNAVDIKSIALITAVNTKLVSIGFGMRIISREITVQLRHINTGTQQPFGIDPAIHTRSQATDAVIGVRHHIAVDTAITVIRSYP